jgi:hypothetical protein
MANSSSAETLIYAIGAFFTLCLFTYIFSGSSGRYTLVASRFESRKSELMTLNNTDYFQSYPSVDAFSLEDTDKLNSLQGSIATLPKIWGYSQERGNQLFPPYFYPRCSARYPPEDDAWVKLNYTSNTLSMKCPGDFKGKYVTGPIYNITFTNTRELRTHWKVNYYKGNPVPINSTTDWVIGSCNPDNAKFELHQHMPRFSPYVYGRTRYRMETLQNTTGTVRKPLIIAMFTLDSFSRRHFFRKLPGTVGLLNHLEKGERWKVFDFKVHNVIGTDTAENQARVFGESFEGYKNENITTDLLEKDAIWYKLKKKGFATLLGFDPCAFKIVKVLGRRPRADHVSNTFFCANARFGGYTSNKRVTHIQRCIGPHMSHYYLMNYTLTFSQYYRGLNQWAYNHFGAAHEKTGQHASTIDEDLVWYIQEYIQKFSQTHDIVFYIMADHGMRYGNFESDTWAIQEHRLPAFFLLTKRSFLRKIPGSYDTLRHNTERLITKPDIRRSIQFLMDYQYNLEMKPSEDNFVNIFTEKVPDSRRCEDVDIPPWYCSAYEFNTIPNYVFDSSNPAHYSMNSTEKDLSTLLTLLADETIQSLNSKVYSVKLYHKGNLCVKMTLNRIELAIWNRISDDKLLVKILLSIEESPEARLDSWILISTHYDMTVPPMEEENFDPFPVTFEGRKLFGKVRNI